MFLSSVAVNVDAPELTAHHALSHACNIGMTEQPFVRIKPLIADAIMKLHAQEPRQIIMPVYERR